jgi:hypothetical protein
VIVTKTPARIKIDCRNKSTSFKLSGIFKPTPILLQHRLKSVAGFLPHAYYLPLYQQFDL